MTTRTTPGRIPPHDVDAEAAVLGSMMVSIDARTEATDRVLTSDFYKPAHAHIFEAITTVHRRGEDVDVVTVAHELGRKDLLDLVGGKETLNRLTAETPLSTHAETYIGIVVKTAALRRLIGIAGDITEMAYDPTSLAYFEDTLDRALSLVEHVHELRAGQVAPPSVRHRGLIGGGEWIVGAAVDGFGAVWGRDDEVLWAAGESMIVTGPTGVGKTTTVAQVVLAGIGLTESAEVLGYPVADLGRVLYLACDRPNQIARVFRALVDPADEHVVETLQERLVIWPGPPVQDFGRHPSALYSLAVQAGANTVILDSLKDVAVGIANDEVGAGLNNAMQLALAEGVNVAATHHQRKGQGSKPNTIEDVYGSTLVPAGAGSVVLLWGAPGDPIVELSHLKPVATAIGPLSVEHNLDAGRSTVSRGPVDVLRLLGHSPGGLTISDVARVTADGGNPTANDKKRAERALRRLVDRGLAHHLEQHRGEGGEWVPARYFAADQTDRKTP